MQNWKYTLDLEDIFHNEDMTFTERRDVIVQRICRSTFYTLDDFELTEIVSMLSEAKRPNDFDGIWNDFYDWADIHRVWVATF